MFVRLAHGICRRTRRRAMVSGHAVVELTWASARSAGLQTEESIMNSMARRMFELVEPIDVIPYSADEPNEAMFALGFTNYWDTYFAGRAAPLGLVPAEVVDTLFYNSRPVKSPATSEGVAHHHARSSHRCPPDGLHEGVTADPGRSRRPHAFAPRGRPVARGCDRRTFEGRPMYCRTRTRSRFPMTWWLVSFISFHAPRAPWRRPRRGPHDRGRRRPRGSRPLRPRHGHARGEVRTHPPPPCSAARRRDRWDARPRPDR